MAIKLNDLIDFLLLNSGQYIGGLEYTMIDQEKLLKLIKFELNVYSRYIPNEKSITTSLYPTKTFTLKRDGFIPEIISRIRYSDFEPVYFYTTRRFGDIPRTYWEYQKPVLLFQGFVGRYTIDYTVNHEYDEENLEFPTLNFGDVEFLNLCLGRFITAVGKGRRTLITQDFPLTTDAEQMSSEGQMIYQDALDNLKNGANFYLSAIY